MNYFNFNTVLFQHGYISESELAEVDYGPSYGNRVATERALREQWGPGLDSVGNPSSEREYE